MPVRNQIAHDPVDYWSGPVEIGPGDRIIDFTWLRYQSKEFSKTHHEETLIIDDLENHLQWVGELEEKLTAFRDELAEHVAKRARQARKPKTRGSL
jgi:hypothetical protein